MSIPSEHQPRGVNALAEVRVSIDELDKIAGRLERSAVAARADWKDVARCGWTTKKARAAYER